MITRKDYMDAPLQEQRAMHRAYYGEVAEEAQVVVSAYLMRRVRVSADEHFNDIPLSAWDNAGYLRRSSVEKALRARGDHWSLAGSVCVFKEAARRQLIKRREPMRFDLVIYSSDAEATEAPRLLIERVLKQVAKIMDASDTTAGVIRDHNGNRVGNWTLVE